MKITRLEIKNYKQFKDLTLDLTYPLGHPKAGEPLDKICIIGQSGVGKTNLLEMVRDRLYDNDVKTSFIEEENSENEKVYFAGTDRVEDDDLSNQNILSESDKILLDGFYKYREELIAHRDKDHIYTFQNNLNSIDSKILNINKRYNITSTVSQPIKLQNFVNINSSAWSLLKEKIASYAKEEKELNSKLFNKIMLDKSYAEEAEKDKKSWQDKNENVAEKISDKLNTILIKFNLELAKIDENQKSYNDLTIKDLSNDNIIDYENLSTGTKNIISTFIPLKIHNPKDSIILIDEPENSFYPDIQRKLTELYMEVGENNQLIMATHSPLIASSFEPWEVVELKFDENTHQIYRELYYDSENDERHIDNYTLDPRMLTWTGILTQIFDLKEDSNFEIREKALMQYIRLERDIEKIEDKKEKMQKFEELMRLSERLGLSDNEKN